MTLSKLLRASGGLIFGAALGLVMANQALAAEYEWTFQTSENTGEPQFEIKKLWASNIEKMTQGRVKIEILPTGAVVPHNQTP